jgi:hypothetical protein
MAEENDETFTEMTQPIIIDLGSQKPGRIKDLKKGEGKLWDEVLDVVDEAKEMLGAEADGKIVIPVILIYEKKSKRGSLDRLIFPFAK